MLVVGGEGGIRTRDTLSGIHTFQACSFNHSDTSPEKATKKWINFALTNSISKVGGWVLDRGAGIDWSR